MSDEQDIERQVQRDQNMRHWESLSVTSAQFTSKVKLGARKYTSINPTYRMMRMTEQFGPVGVGWWYEVHMRERQGKPVMWTAGKDIAPQVMHETIMEATVDLYYYPDGLPTPENPLSPSSAITATGSAAYHTCSNGVKWLTDLDAPKKAQTDALSKAMVSLGVSADVYMGLWDDPIYEGERQLTLAEELELEKAAIEEQRETATAEHNEWRNTVILKLRSNEIETLKELKSVYDAAMRKEKTHIVIASDEAGNDAKKRFIALVTKEYTKVETALRQLAEAKKQASAKEAEKTVEKVQEIKVREDNPQESK